MSLCPLIAIAGTFAGTGHEFLARRSDSRTRGHRRGLPRVFLSERDEVVIFPLYAPSIASRPRSPSPETTTDPAMASGFAAGRGATAEQGESGRHIDAGATAAAA